MPVAAMFVAALALVGCTAIAPNASPRLRALDAVAEDISSIVIALDLPLSLRPLPEQSRFNITYQSPSGSRDVSAALAFGDPGDAAGTLPPPGPARTYYLLSLAGSSAADIAAAQAWAREQGASARLSANASFCRTGHIAPDAKISVLLALPGSTALEPLLLNQPLTSFTTGEIPIC